MHNLGQSIDRLDAIVFLPDFQAAPSLSTLGLAILALLLVLAGTWQLNGRLRKVRNVVG